MIPSKYLLGFAILLFVFLSFYTVESFIQSSLTRVIELEDSLPIIRIEIVYNGDPKKGTFLHLADLELIDNKDKVVQYWKSPNSVHFQQADTGFQGKTGPIEKLYDGDINTFAHSSVSPDKLTILLKPYGANIKTIQITNRKDCCEDRIKQYEMHLYSNAKRVGGVPLTELGEKGKSIIYSLIQPSIATKSPSQAEKERFAFNRKFDEYKDNTDEPVVNQTTNTQNNSTSNSGSQLYDSRRSNLTNGSMNSDKNGPSYAPSNSYGMNSMGSTYSPGNSYDMDRHVTSTNDLNNGPSYSDSNSTTDIQKLYKIPGGPDGTHQVKKDTA